jgi:hypothetical protein
MVTDIEDIHEKCLTIILRSFFLEGVPYPEDDNDVISYLLAANVPLLQDCS